MLRAAAFNNLMRFTPWAHRLTGQHSGGQRSFYPAVVFLFFSSAPLFLFFICFIVSFHISATPWVEMLAVGRN